VAARRMWYDTVGHGHVPALRCAIDSFGADRLLLGTDFPYENGDIFVRAVDYITDPQIDPDAARAILDHNASALLGIGQERQERPVPGEDEVICPVIRELGGQHALVGFAGHALRVRLPLRLQCCCSGWEAVCAG
jgi:Amidohydrolase